MKSKILCCAFGVVGALLFASCGGGGSDEPGPVDSAGAFDATLVVDGALASTDSAVDARPVDVQSVDGAVIDARPIDAQSIDARPIDATVTPDAAQVGCGTRVCGAIAAQLLDCGSCPSGERCDIDGQCSTSCFGSCTDIRGGAVCEAAHVITTCNSDPQKKMVGECYSGFYFVRSACF